MRVLNGKRIVDADAAILARLDRASIVIDLGAGDGRYAYERARLDPDRLFVAVDPDAATLAEYAYRAGRKPARGGVENAIFVVAAVEALPPELLGVAARVRVNFPWGSLLRGLLEPAPSTLDQVASLLAPDAILQLVMSYDPAHDTGAFAAPPLPPLNAKYLEASLVPAYEAAGLAVRERKRLTQDEALAVPSTWGRRLLHARPRDVFYVECGAAAR